MGKWAEENEHLRSVIINSHAKIEDNGQKIQRASVAKAELDVEIRGLQAGDEKRGGTSQSNVCCMDPAFLQHFLTPATALAIQQLVLLQTEFGKKYVTQHHLAPVTPVHVPEGGEENDEEQKRRAASRDNGPRVPGGRDEGFSAGSLVDTSMPPMNTDEGDGDEFGSPREGDGSRGRQVRKVKHGPVSSRRFSAVRTRRKEEKKNKNK